jgi:hypothetical protein
LQGRRAKLARERASQGTASGGIRKKLMPRTNNDIDVKLT